MTAAQTFGYTGAPVTVTVPADASYATVEGWGTQGSGATGAPGAGGLGDYAKGDLPVTPGEQLVISVGLGGGPGGPGGGGPGGGASDVRRSGGTLADRVIVAAGGQGRGLSRSGAPSSSAVGGDATPTSGGVAGQAGPGGVNGSAGTLGQGGIGGTLTYNGVSSGAGGGGAGLYGGGGGATYISGTSPNGADGGRGSSYVGGVVNGVTSVAVWTGNGQVVITWKDAAPLAPTPTDPANNQAVLKDAAVARWGFNAGAPGDVQTKADVQYRQVGAPSWTVVTGAATTDGSYAFPVLTDGGYEWQVRGYGKTGVAGPWSASSFFTAVTKPPAPTITAPANGATLMNTPTTVTLTVPAGQTATAYQVQRTDGGSTVYYDTGTVPVGPVSVPLDAVFGRTEHIKAAYQASGVWSDWADITVTVNAGPPQDATLLLTLLADDAAVQVTVRNPDQAPGYAAAVSNDLWRVNPDGTTTQLAAGLPANPAPFTDWLPGAGVNDYIAVVYASTGAHTPIPTGAA